MGMIKKIFIIILLILIIIANVQVVFADEAYDFPYNQNNINLSSVSTYINGFPSSVIDDLRTNEYKSVFSRYSSSRINVSISSVSIFLQIGYTPSVVDTTSYNSFRTYFSNYNNNFVVGALSVNENNLRVTYNTLQSSGRYYVNINISGSLSYVASLKNLLLDTNLPFDSQTITSSGFAMDLFYSQFTYNGYDYSLYSVGSGGNGGFDYIVKCSFDYPLNNVSGMIFEHYVSLIPTGNDLINIDFSSDAIRYGFSNGLYDANGLFNNFAFQANFIDDTKIQSFSINSHKINSSHTQNVTTNSSYPFKMNFVIVSPIAYNKQQDFITSSSNENTNTPLQLTYYDCEWYELHYQLANAFIFMITELPIVSDVTNVIYSIIQLFQNAFDVLSQFSGFTILFAFGMFAIVVGLLIRLFMGED